MLEARRSDRVVIDRRRSGRWSRLSSTGFSARLLLSARSLAPARRQTYTLKASRSILEGINTATGTSQLGCREYGDPPNFHGFRPSNRNKLGRPSALRNMFHLLSRKPRSVTMLLLSITIRRTSSRCAVGTMVTFNLVSLDQPRSSTAIWSAVMFASGAASAKESSRAALMRSTRVEP